MKNYKLCGLSQGAQRSQGWIEERGARLGASVEIPELGGFWEVIGVGETVKDKAAINEAEARGRKPFTAMKAYRTT